MPNLSQADRDRLCGPRGESLRRFACAQQVASGAAIGDTGRRGRFVDIETIDQAPSEVRLHRVLWLVKFLRALVLHVLVAVVAAAVYFLTGFDKLSPLAIDMLRSMRAQAIQNRLDGNPLGEVGFAIGAAILFVAFLIFVTWIYRSITNVRRRALQVQAILWLAVSLWNSAANGRKCGSRSTISTCSSPSFPPSARR
jgi:hypothetical protein